MAYHMFFSGSFIAYFPKTMHVMTYVVVRNDRNIIYCSCGVHRTLIVIIFTAIPACVSFLFD